MMSTNKNTNTNEEVKVENPQVENEVQVTEQQVPAQQTQTEEKKEGFLKRAWNKAKKPAAIALGFAAAFGAGVATDHFIENRKSSKQDGSAAGEVEQPTENSVH
jgi:hypothetical protein